jgi:SSS family solute:Na+ symporter
VTQLVIISLYLSLLLGLGVVAGRLFRGTSKDYMLASHSIGPFLLLMSIFGTTMTAFALVGSSGEAYKEGVGVYGMLASSSGIIHSLCFFLVGVKLWGFGHRHGYTTQIQFFRDRLESDKFGLLLFPILVGLVIPYLLIGVMASGTVISSITEGAFSNYFAAYDYGVPPWLGSLVICVVVLIYVFFGGMRGTAWANAFQTLVFMALGVVTFVVISQKLGGMQAASEAVAKMHPSKLMRSVTEKEEQDYEANYESWSRLAEYNWSVENRDLVLSESQKQAANQPLKGKPIPPWQRSFRELRAEAAYAAKNGLIPELSPADEQRAKIAQDDRLLPANPPENWESLPLSSFPRNPGWEKQAVAHFAAQIGHPSLKNEGKMTLKQAQGRYRAMRWAPEQPHGIDPWIFFTYLLVPLSVGMFPHLFQHWLTAKSAASFKLPVVAHPIFIMLVWVPCVLIGVWATSATIPGKPVALIPPHFNPNAVLAYMVSTLTNPVLAGFLTAGILAAIMSSLDSQFLCIGTIFTEDVAVHYGGRDRFSDKQVVLMARLFVIAIVAVTYILSLMGVRRVFTLGVWCFSGFSSLFPLVFAAVYWRRLTKPGAYACVIAAIASWLYLFDQSGYGAQPWYSFLGMMPVATMVACSTAALVLVSLLTRPPSDATLAKFFQDKSQPHDTTGMHTSSADGHRSTSSVPASTVWLAKGGTLIGAFRVGETTTLPLATDVTLSLLEDGSLIVKGKYDPPGTAIFAFLATIGSGAILAIMLSALGFAAAPGWLVWYFIIKFIRRREIILNVRDAETVLVDSDTSRIAIKTVFEGHKRWIALEMLSNFQSAAKGIETAFPNKVKRGDIDKPSMLPVVLLIVVILAAIAFTLIMTL